MSQQYVVKWKQQTSVLKTSLSPVITVYSIPYLSLHCFSCDVINQNRKRNVLCSLVGLETLPIWKYLAYKSWAEYCMWSYFTLIQVGPVRGNLFACSKLAAQITPVKSLLVLYGSIFFYSHCTLWCIRKCWSLSVVPELFLIKDTHRDEGILPVQLHLKPFLSDII